MRMAAPVQSQSTAPDNFPTIRCAQETCNPRNLNVAELSARCAMCSPHRRVTPARSTNVSKPISELLARRKCNR